jgi:hypothetical protein
MILRLSLDCGMPVAEAAGFLARDEDEVREKAEELSHSAYFTPERPSVGANPGKTRVGERRDLLATVCQQCQGALAELACCVLGCAEGCKPVRWGNLNTRPEKLAGCRVR